MPDREPEPPASQNIGGDHGGGGHHGGGGGLHHGGHSSFDFEGLFSMFESTLAQIVASLNAPKGTDPVNRRGLEQTIRTRRTLEDEDVLRGLLTNTRQGQAAGSIDEVVDLATGKRYKDESAARNAGVTNFVKAYLYDTKPDDEAA